MSIRKIRVELDHDTDLEPTWHFAPGEEIRGIVILDIRHKVTCRSVILTMQWNTRKCRQERGIQRKQQLFRGVFETDSVFVLPFQFISPYDPWSYEGDLFAIEWWFNIEVDLVDYFHKPYRRRVWIRPKTPPLPITL